MNDKVTLQAVSELFSNHYGVSKKTTDAFGKSFFDTIVDGLNQDGQVKIKGLGTFKIVDVSSRESVNVTNGERIVIDGYRKVAFIPDEIAELKKEEEIKNVEDSVTLAGIDEGQKVGEQIDAVISEAEAKAVDEVMTEVLADGQEPENVEKSKDEFSGIDNIICTPESLNELRKDLHIAEIRAQQTLEEAKLANAEFRRLQILLDRLESNHDIEIFPEIFGRTIAASVACSVKPETEPVVENVAETANDEIVIQTGAELEAVAPDAPQTSAAAPLTAPSEQEKAEPADAGKQPEPTDAPSEESASAQSAHDEALSRFLSQKPNEPTPEVQKKESKEKASKTSGKHTALWIILLLIICVLAGVAYYLYCNSQKEAMKAPTPVKVEKVVPKALVPVSDSIKSDTAKSVQPVVAGDEAVKKTADNSKALSEQKKALAEKEAAEKKALAEKAAAEKKAKEVAKKNVQKIHTVAKGQSLTRISQIYYGTKDSVRAIIRVNKFANPDIVPEGTVIKLP